MFEYEIENESCVYLKSQPINRSKGISSHIHLMNGVTSEEFIANMQDHMSRSDDHIIALDCEDIECILSERDEAYYGKMSFTVTGNNYVTFDDVEWLKRINVEEMCIFFEGSMGVKEAQSVANLIRTLIPNFVNCLFGFKIGENSDIKVNLLVA
ncbi:MAG: hypothetical protein K6G45_02280 [Lachnospiraceae bacterium]|nr:hypothetical protein [Lachnospiraceae bacterium]